MPRARSGAIAAGDDRASVEGGVAPTGMIRPRSRSVAALLAALLLPLSAAAALLRDADAPAARELSQAQAAIDYIVGEDARIATVAYRLNVANLPLCPQHGFDLGISVHALDQYQRALRPAAARLFGLADLPGISAVVPSGPAAAAGLQPGDSLVAADGAAFAPAIARPPAGGTYATVQQALNLIDRAAADGTVRFRILRAGRALEREVRGTPACAVRVQLQPSAELNSWADDRYATITTAMARYAAADDDLALVMGHELAHAYLHHEALLDRRSVARGLLGPLGSPPGLVLETERQADYLGLYIAARAGYDMRRAADFWQRFRAEHGGGDFLLHTHPRGRDSLRAGAATMAEIERKRAAGEALLPDPKLIGRGP